MKKFDEVITKVWNWFADLLVKAKLAEEVKE
jgi:hypothetical protein